MTNSKIDIFERLKRKRTVVSKRRATSSLFFQLNFDEVGAYIRVVDQNQKEVEANYRHYSGHTRQILKSIENIDAKNSFRIDWEIPTDRIYLDENEHLIWQLRHSDNFVDAELNPISFVDEQTLSKILVLVEEEEEGRLESKRRRYRPHCFPMERYPDCALGRKGSGKIA